MNPQFLESFSESDSLNYTHNPTDYFQGTVAEPDHVLPLRASFGEYESLGKKHQSISDRIQELNEAMKLSRQRGAFQTLQNQMKEVKTLVKERENVDAQMAVIDLARKKTDDYKLAIGVEPSFSESLNSFDSKIKNFEEMFESFSETLDYARCKRPDGTTYGTKGSCMPPNVVASSPGPKLLKPGFPKRRLNAEEEEAYKAGGGGAKVEKSGLTTNEVINQGRANRKKAGGSKVGSALSKEEREAYKNGGGNAAAQKSIGGIDEVIDKGRNNLKKKRSKSSNFSEDLNDEFDFARCQRPDGSFYGTRGKCKKGTEAGAAAPRVPSKKRAASAKPATKKVAIPSDKLQKIEEKIKEKEITWNNAKQAHATAKNELKSFRGRSKSDRIQRQILSQKAYEAEEKLRKAAEDLIRSKIVRKKVEDKAAGIKITPEERALNREIRERG